RRHLAAEPGLPGRDDPAALTAAGPRPAVARGERERDEHEPGGAAVDDRRRERPRRAVPVDRGLRHDRWDEPGDHAGGPGGVDGEHDPVRPGSRARRRATPPRTRGARYAAPGAPVSCTAWVTSASSMTTNACRADREDGRAHRRQDLQTPAPIHAAGPHRLGSTPTRAPRSVGCSPPTCWARSSSRAATRAPSRPTPPPTPPSARWPRRSPGCAAAGRRRTDPSVGASSPRVGPEQAELLEVGLLVGARVPGRSGQREVARAPGGVLVEVEPGLALEVHVAHPHALAAHLV